MPDLILDDGFLPSFGRKVVEFGAKFVMFLDKIL